MGELRRIDPNHELIKDADAQSARATSADDATRDGAVENNHDASEEAIEREAAIECIRELEGGAERIDAQ